ASFSGYVADSRAVARCSPARRTLVPIKIGGWGTGSVRGNAVGVRGGLLAPLYFELRQLGLDVLLGPAPADDLFAVAPQEIINRLDADADGAGGPVFVHVF